MTQYSQKIIIIISILIGFLFVLGTSMNVLSRNTTDLESTFGSFDTSGQNHSDIDYGKLDFDILGKHFNGDDYERIYNDSKRKNPNNLTAQIDDTVDEKNFGILDQTDEYDDLLEYDEEPAEDELSLQINKTQAVKDIKYEKFITNIIDNLNIKEVIKGLKMIEDMELNVDTNPSKTQDNGNTEPETSDLNNFYVKTITGINNQDCKFPKNEINSGTLRYIEYHDKGYFYLVNSERSKKSQIGFYKSRYNIPKYVNESQTLEKNKIKDTHYKLPESKTALNCRFKHLFSYNDRTLAIDKDGAVKIFNNIRQNEEEYLDNVIDFYFGNCMHELANEYSLSVSDCKKYGLFVVISEIFPQILDRNVIEAVKRQKKYKELYSDLIGLINYNRIINEENKIQECLREI